MRKKTLVQKLPTRAICWQEPDEVLEAELNWKATENGEAETGDKESVCMLFLKRMMTMKQARLSQKF